MIDICMTCLLLVLPLDRQQSLSRTRVEFSGLEVELLLSVAKLQSGRGPKASTLHRTGAVAC